MVSKNKTNDLINQGDVKNLAEETNRAFKSYLALLLVLAVFSGLSTLLPEGGHFITGDIIQVEPLAVIFNMAAAFILYGILGLFGLRLAGEMELPRIYPGEYFDLRFVLEPAVFGIILGVFYILLDITLAPLHELGHLPHPDLSAAVISGVASAISAELMYRLFLIPFIIYLIISLMKFFGKYEFFSRRKVSGRLFWTAALLAAVIFTAGHFYKLLSTLETVSLAEMSDLLILKIILMNLSLALLAAWQYKRYGFLSAVLLHIWLIVSWNIVWGNFILN